MVHAGCIYVKLWSVICFGTRSYYHHGPCTERIHLTGRNHDQKRVTQKGKEERRRNSFIYNDSFHLNILVGVNFLILKFKKLNMKQLVITLLFGCVPLRWSGSGSVIQDHSDHGRSKWTDESLSRVDSLVYLIFTDPSDFGSLIVIRIIWKECTLCELILFNWTLSWPLACENSDQDPIWTLLIKRRIAREDSDLCQNKNYTSREHRDFHRLTSYSGHPHMTSIVVDERYLHSNTYHNIFISIPIYRNGIAFKLFNYKIIK